MNYRLLPPSEWQRLLDYMDSEGYGAYTPHPDAAAVAVAEDDDGNIQGVLPLQLQWHLEPLVLSGPSVRFDKLYDVLEEAFQVHPNTRFCCYTNDDKVERIAEHLGMSKLGVAWSGSFAKEDG